MVFASKMRFLGAALVLALTLPGVSLGEVTGNCSQDPDNPPERGQNGSVSVVTTPEKAMVYLGGQNSACPRWTRSSQAEGTASPSC
jgi:hypothetical protein